ncbi:MAG: ATP-binding protein [Bacteroidales bacterium]|nr:ATP-binding protein [Bacteroidales bacterium]
MAKEYIKRAILSDLKSHLNRKEITMLVGPRQCGKTTTMNLLKKDLEEKNNKVLFLNLDITEDKKYLATQEKLINKIKLEFGNDPGFVFIDEVQRKENAGLFLKGIYDMDLPYKFIVSGSGNIELKEKVSESLMGRKRLFNMSTITFDEFVNFKTEYKYEDRLEQFFEIEEEKGENFLLEYLNFGGYPRVITSISLEEKNIEIDEIYQSYINKDIIKWLRVEKIDAFEKMMKISASQVGNLVSYSSLANGVGISVETVKNYLWYLEKTFVLDRCRPFFKNKKKEIIKSPIFYFHDIGLRNYAVNKFGKLDEIDDNLGFLFENFTFNILKERLYNSNTEINFWRTKSCAEVDFVIDFESEIIPIEVKFKNFSKMKIEKSIQSFIKKYKPKNAFVVNKNLSGKITFKNTNVCFTPFWKIKDEII